MSIMMKIGEIFEKFYSVSSLPKLHKARQDFISYFITGMIKSRNVHFCEIASHMDTQVGISSNLRRIQKFFAEYKINYRLIAIVLLTLLPRGRKIILGIDRTNWYFGKTDINFLVISAYCRGVGIPIWFELLSDKKRGNSNEKERIALLRQVLKLLEDKQVILCADREFIGQDWVKFLMKSKVHFFIRLRKSTRLLYQDQNLRADEWMTNQKYLAMDNVLVQGFWLSVEICKTSLQGEDELVIILTNTQSKGALQQYKNRWSIEVFFQSIKNRGFKIENTHLTDEKKLRKLMALVAIAFTICLRLGIIYHDTSKKIPMKNHGYKANSFFRYGLDIIRENLRLKHEIDIIIDIIVNAINNNKQYISVL